MRLSIFASAISGTIFTSNAELRETAIAPVRILWISDSSGTSISNAENLLKPFSGQVSVNNSANSTIMISTSEKQASILLDFGCEIYGGLKIYTGMSADKSATRLNVCLGESVTEAMSNVNIANNPQNPTNEHSLRDFPVNAPWLGSVECGNSGFRFARIDLIDTNEAFPLRYVEARAIMHDTPEVGTFECSDQRLTDIWNTGAYTVKLNMQDYVWDGIKRDRLVWLGDMHPEVMTIATVWGEMPVVHKTLNYAVDDTPLPGWMNGHSSYSLWWLIIQRDLYLYQGNIKYLRQQKDYIHGLVSQICNHVDANGKETLNGARFLDWPSSVYPDAVASGLQSLTHIGLTAATDIAHYLNDYELLEMASTCLKRMENITVQSHGSKQAAALGIISGRSANTSADAATIIKNGADNFSTFYGYYMLEALAAEGKLDDAMALISSYWGAMIDLGATTFWEDLKFSDVANAARIDEFVPEGKHDIHAGGGDFCYKGLRLSLCHGWASGPTAWMSRHILGFHPLAPGCATLEISPYLGKLTWAKGSFPTPKGTVFVDITRQPDGTTTCNVKAPKGVKIVNRAKGKVTTYTPKK